MILADRDASSITYERGLAKNNNFLALSIWTFKKSYFGALEALGHYRNNAFELSRPLGITKTQLLRLLRLPVATIILVRSTSCGTFIHVSDRMPIAKRS